MARAVFFDRDGVINREVDYLRRVEDLQVLPGAARAMRTLREAGFRVIVVTNQSGVARGLLSRTRLSAIHRELKRRLARQGARWDALYYSPHAADSAHPMRKPGVGMLRLARARFGLDLGRSYLIGDTTTDIKTARNAGCAAVLVRTGKAGRDGKFPEARPDAVRRDAADAARWILSRERAAREKLQSRKRRPRRKE